ncbi:MAG: histidine kinase [Bacteroidetes bacterium]|nr:histidine kinase [Bacteroidota bacterium]
MTNKNGGKNLGKTCRLQVIAWLTLFLMLSVILSFTNSIDESMLISALIFLPVIPPVYINFYFFNKYYVHGKYLLYFVFAITNVAFFGLLGEIAADNLYNNPGDQLGSLAFPLLFVLVTLGIKNFRDSINSKLRIEEANAIQAQTELKLKKTESMQIAAELEILRGQINPHFLFNTLNSIYSMAIDKSEDTSKAILLLSKLFRYQLEHSQKTKVAVIREIDFISDYIELEKFRLGDSCKIVFKKDDIDKSFTITPFILFPFVENCFKHGIGLNSDNNIIQLLLRINDGKLYFEASNSIPPDKQSDIIKEGETGIENVRKRLEILYPEHHKLNITNHNKIFMVKLSIT